MKLKYRNINEQWLYFKDVTKNLIDKYVPSTKITQGQKGQNIPCDKNTLEKMRKTSSKKKSHRNKSPTGENAV